MSPLVSCSRSHACFQVLEQFRENSQTSVRKISEVVKEREDTESDSAKIAEKGKEWLEAIRWAEEGKVGKVGGS